MSPDSHRRAGAAVFAALRTPVTLNDMTCSKTSDSHSFSKPMTPAQVTSPARLSIPRKASLTSEVLITSQCRKRAFSGEFGSFSRPTAVICQPLSTSRCAVTSPMPVPPPVITTLGASVFWSFSIIEAGHGVDQIIGRQRLEVVRRVGPRE